MQKIKGLAQGDYRKVMITLTASQEKFLDQIKNEILAKKGHSLSRTEIIRASIDFVATLDINLEGIKDEFQLLERIKDAISK